MAGANDTEALHVIHSLRCAAAHLDTSLDTHIWYFSQEECRSELLVRTPRILRASGNAAMEGSSLLQKNVPNQHSWATRKQLRLAIVHWIEARYHSRRRQRRLRKLTPIEFETIMKDAVTWAADGTESTKASAFPPAEKRDQGLGAATA
ncbi:hypothetical protein GCM10023152_11300 [Agromyces bauzanensis]|uniref:Uncharacterized protein n=1 Tax=Agromyces bauzanensis TaxID=1308924 RepID=A0A917UM96_9MICO|nr:hypothetical protein GCM10011372_01630 [Agromyces bauzanensis]